MSAQPLPGLTPEQYLEIERAAEFKSEYYRGTMYPMAGYAMAGGKFAHARISARIIILLGQKLDAARCAIVGSDARLRVSIEGLYTYPDVMVICDRPKFTDDQEDTVLNPLLIVEVLSKSTEAYDRGFKSAQYRRLESLQEYVLVSQAEPRIERYVRQPAGKWELTEFVGPDAVWRSDTLGCEVPLTEIYRSIELAPEESAGPPANP